MAGYYGYSMSNNACAAYEAGMMPRSKWTKKAIMYRVAILSEEEEIELLPERIKELSGMKVAVLRELLLRCREWHHTSSRYNCTDFYDVDIEILSYGAQEWQEAVKEAAGEVGKEKQPEAPVRQRGTFYWVTWEGTRNHPRAREHKMDNALVEQRGKFYYVYDNEGSMVVRKMVGSNGTIFCPAVK